MVNAVVLEQNFKVRTTTFWLLINALNTEIIIMVNVENTKEINEHIRIEQY